VPVGCHVDAGVLDSCTVKAFAGTRLVGRGTTAGDGDAGVVVRVALSKQGRALVHRIGGVRLTYRAIATRAGGSLTDTATSRVLPLTATALPTDGSFASGDRTLNRAGRAFVRATARQLRGAKRVTCVGHTDSLRSVSFNKRLGVRRAKLVCAELRRLGVHARLVTRSAGESKPRATNTTARGRALNRRVELRVTYR
jgi:outer membrane protein OmpA-like peptidoglycan-associated protein